MRTPQRRKTVSSSSSSFPPNPPPLGKKELASLLKEAERFVLGWRAQKKNPTALLVAFKRVFGGDDDVDECTTTLLRYDEEGRSVLTVELSAKTMSPLLPLLSEDFDGWKTPRSFSKTPNTAVNEESSDEEEEDHRKGNRAEDEDEDDPDELSEPQAHDGLFYVLPKSNREKNKRSYVLQQRSKQGNRGTVTFIGGKSKPKPKRKENEASVENKRAEGRMPPAKLSRPNEAVSNSASVRSAVLAQPSTPTPAQTVPTPLETLSTTRRRNKPEKDAETNDDPSEKLSEPDVDGSKASVLAPAPAPTQAQAPKPISTTKLAPVAPKEVVPATSTPLAARRSTSDAPLPTTPALAAPSLTAVKPKQDDLTFCRDFLKACYGKTAEEEEIINVMEVWFSVKLELSEPPKAVDAVPSPESPRLFTQQQPAEREGDETNGKKEEGEEEEDEELDSGKVTSSPACSSTFSSSTLSTSTSVSTPTPTSTTNSRSDPSIAMSSSEASSMLSKEIKRLFMFLGDVRTQKKEIQKKRWKAECLLSLRVAELRDLVKKEKKLWKDVEQTLCRELDCKKTRMKQIVTAGKLFCRLGILLFPSTKIPQHKRLDRFAKKWKLHQRELRTEFEWLQPKENVSPRPLLEALKQPSSTGIKEVARLFAIPIRSLSGPFPSPSSTPHRPPISSSQEGSPQLLTQVAPDSVLGKRTRSEEEDQTSASMSAPSSSTSPQPVPASKKKKEVMVVEVEDSSSSLEAKTAERPAVSPEALENLRQGREVDDEVIMFYARHLLDQLDPETRSKLHLFDSQCFRAAEGRKRQSEEDKNRAAGAAVEDLFEKEHLLFPVHHAHHWILAVVDRPGQAMSENEDPGCRLRFMDSLSRSSERSSFYHEVCDKVADLLNRAWSLRRGSSCRPFDRKSLKPVVWKVPEQPNAVDCGLYLLKCLEKFLEERENRCVKFASSEASLLRQTIPPLVERGRGQKHDNGSSDSEFGFSTNKGDPKEQHKRTQHPSSIAMAEADAESRTAKTGGRERTSLEGQAKPGKHAKKKCKRSLGQASRPRI